MGTRKKKAHSIYDSITDELTAEINKWKTLGEDNSLKISKKSLKELSDSLFETTMKTYLTGRFEMFKRNEKVMIENELKEWNESHFALADPVSVIFDLPFDKAVEHLEKLMPINKKELAELSKEIRHKYLL